MSISKIKVLSRRGVQRSTLVGSVRIRPGNAGLNIAVDAGNKLVTVSSPDYDDIYGNAKEQLQSGCWLSTINSRPPTDDGAFFFGGSKCISWSYVRNEENASSILNVLPGSDYRGTHKIIVNDLCAACSTCESVLTIKKIIEHYKIVLNAIKDANLYENSIMQARQDYLRSKRIPIDASFTELLDSIDPAILARVDIESNRLLGQYMTVVHMWNYIASRQERKTVIGPASEDPSGFYLFTKCPKPTCDGISDIECEVQVSMVQGQNGLSVFVPAPTVEFDPFIQDGGSPMAAEVTMTTNTDGTVSIQRIQGGLAGTKIGTYIAKMRWLPFFAVKQEITAGSQVNPTDYDSCTYERTTEIDVERGGERVLYSKLAISVDKVSLETTPTKTDYVKYRKYLATASEATNRWQITVTWRLTGQLSQEFVDTYYYETPGVGEPVTGMYRNTELHNPGSTPTN